MDIKQLNYFQKIVEQGGISAAARALRVAQPVLSRSLQALESELGGVLLHRGKSGIELTQQGKDFYLKVNDLLALYDSVLSNPFNHENNKNQQVNYARTEYWRSWPLTAFHDAVYESEELNIDSSIILSPESGLDALLKGEVDILLSHDKKWVHEKIHLLFQKQFQWGLYLDDNFFSAKKDFNLDSIPCLIWANKNDLFAHQWKMDYPQRSVKFMGGYEDLMIQKNNGSGMILPKGLKLEPSGFSLRQTLPTSLTLLVYSRTDRYEPSLLQTLKKGLSERW